MHEVFYNSAEAAAACGDAVDRNLGGAVTRALEFLREAQRFGDSKPSYGEPEPLV